MPTKKELCGENGQKILQTIADERWTKLRNFFVDYEEETGIRSGRGLPNRIRERLKNNPFETVAIADDSFRTKISRWLNGTTLDRATAYQICIALKLGLDISELFFKDYLNTEFARFNDWREILYYYCLDKGYCLNKTYKLYLRCINEVGLDKQEAGVTIQNPSVTILTSVIKEAYNKDLITNDEVFITYMTEQKENFHRVSNTRRRAMMEEIIGKLIKQYDENEVSKVDGKLYEKDFWRKSLLSSLANAFFEDEDKDEDEDNDEDEDENNDEDEDEDENKNNDEYFEAALNAIENREKNFSREFFILCMLISGTNSWQKINDMLTEGDIYYSDLNPDNLFDACILEACGHHERTKDSMYDRFCENTQLLKYKRPFRFAFED